MPLCKEKKKLHISLWRIMYTLSYSEHLHTKFLCTIGVFPSSFYSCIPPPKILRKSNQTFQIIERIYTAPYLLFIIIIIHFTKENLKKQNI